MVKIIGESERLKGFYMENTEKSQQHITFPQKDYKEETIGKLLLDLGKIQPEDAERILKLQKSANLRFGDAALKLGLISEEDITHVLSLQFDYPYLPEHEGSFSQDLVAAYHPFSKQVEALRALRSQLILRWFNEGNKALAVIAPSKKEPSGTIAANLAVVFSQLGEHTLLIDANLRNPTQHKIFNLPQHPGLSDILAGRASFDVATKIPSFLDLTVLGAGTIAPNPQELLSRPAFAELIDQVQTKYDVVIVDTSPLRENSDAQTVVERCGGALVVSKLNYTKLSDLNNLRNQVTSAHASLVGAVIVDD